MRTLKDETKGMEETQEAGLGMGAGRNTEPLQDPG